MLTKRQATEIAKAGVDQYIETMTKLGAEKRRKLRGIRTGRVYDDGYATRAFALMQSVQPTLLGIIHGTFISAATAEDDETMRAKLVETIGAILIVIDQLDSRADSPDVGADKLQDILKVDLTEEEMEHLNKIGELFSE